MGVKYKEQIEGIQKKSLSQKGVRVIVKSISIGKPVNCLPNPVALPFRVVWKQPPTAY